jgi:hypothetical protein
MAPKRPLTENISNSTKIFLRRFTGVAFSQPEPQSSSSHAETSSTNPPPPVDLLTTPGASATTAVNDSGSAAWEGLLTALRGLEKCSNVFHPLKSAVSALVDCLELLPVGFFCIPISTENSYRRCFLNRKLTVAVKSTVSLRWNSSKWLIL